MIQQLPNDTILHILSYLTNSSRIHHVRLVNKSMFQLSNESIIHIELKEPTTTTTKSKSIHSKKERIALLFHVLKQFSYVRRIHVKQMYCPITVKHVAKLARLYCNYIEEFRLNGIVLNACEDDKVLKEFLSSCRYYQSVGLFAKKRQEIDSDECAKEIAQYGENLVKLYLFSSIQTLPMEMIFNTCIHLQKIHIAAMKHTLAPFDISGIRQLKNISLIGSNFLLDGIERCVEQCKNTLQKVSLCTTDAIQFSFFNAVLTHNVDQLERLSIMSLESVDSTGDHLKTISSVITQNLTTLKSFALRNFALPFDADVATSLLECTNFSKLTLINVPVKDPALSIISQNRNLKYLKLKDVEPEEEDLAVFGSDLVKCNLHSISLGDYNPAIIHSILCKHTELRHIAVASLDDADPLINMPHLQYLKIRTFLGDDVLITIGNKLTNIVVKYPPE
jgi:hypothetical protein